jgi:hypothetical protein
VATTKARGVTRRQVIKAAGTLAGAAAVTAAMPKALGSVSASSTDGVMWTDGLVRPPGSPVQGDQLQQRRITAVIFPDGTGYGVQTDDAYHGTNDDTDATATEFAIKSAQRSDGGMTFAGTVLRAVDPGSVGKDVALTLSLGGAVGTCKYTTGDFTGEGFGVLLT